MVLDLEVKLLTDLPHVRRVLREFSRPAGHLAGDVVLAAHELVTNSLTHTAGTCRIAGCYPRERVVRIDVVDEGGDVFEVPSVLPSALAAGGRGLMIVGMVASRWGIRTDPGLTRVWFEVDIGDVDRCPDG